MTSPTSIAAIASRGRYSAADLSYLLQHEEQASKLTEMLDSRLAEITAARIALDEATRAAAEAHRQQMAEQQAALEAAQQATADADAASREAERAQAESRSALATAQAQATAQTEAARAKLAAERRALAEQQQAADEIARERESAIVTAEADIRRRTAMLTEQETSLAVRRDAVAQARDRLNALLRPLALLGERIADAERDLAALETAAKAEE